MDSRLGSREHKDFSKQSVPKLFGIWALSSPDFDIFTIMNFRAISILDCDPLQAPSLDWVSALLSGPQTPICSCFNHFDHFLLLISSDANVRAEPSEVGWPLRQQLDFLKPMLDWSSAISQLSMHYDWTLELWTTAISI